ncbi:MAG: (Fe-S)-binding protein, partial [Actinomycetota bacterium]|nr:(Fe-S)-binding protein [Actinomycetota bacterium]
RWLGLDVVLPHPTLTRIAAALQPAARPFLPRRVRAMLPRRSAPFARLPAVTAPPADAEERGTVALLSGCVQDRWFHEVNLATIRVLAGSGWRVVVPRGQRCCGALQAHNGRLETARRLATRNARAFAGIDHVVVNAAGCSAHMRTYAALAPGAGLPSRDVMDFLFDTGLGGRELRPVGIDRVAYHDPCHALRAQGIREQPRVLLRSIPDMQVIDVPHGDTCCGAAGLYNITEPGLAERLQREKAESLRSTRTTVIVSANPGCTMQLRAGLAAIDVEARVLHPIELLDAAMA